MEVVMIRNIIKKLVMFSLVCLTGNSWATERAMLENGLKTSSADAQLLKNGLAWAGAGLDVALLTGGTYVGLSLADRCGFTPTHKAVSAIALAGTGLAASYGIQKYLGAMGSLLCRIADNQVIAHNAVMDQFQTVHSNFEIIQSGIIAAQEENRTEHDATREQMHSRIDGLETKLNLEVITREVQPERAKIKFPSLSKGQHVRLSLGSSGLGAYLPGATVGATAALVAGYTLWRSGLLGNPNS